MMNKDAFDFDILRKQMFKALNNDRTTNLHTRSLKYGKLENGILVSVHNKLVDSIKTLSKNIKK